MSKGIDNSIESLCREIGELEDKLDSAATEQERAALERHIDNRYKHLILLELKKADTLPPPQLVLDSLGTNIQLQIQEERTASMKALLERERKEALAAMRFVERMGYRLVPEPKPSGKRYCPTFDIGFENENDRGW